MVSKFIIVLDCEVPEGDDSDYPIPVAVEKIKQALTPEQVANIKSIHLAIREVRDEVLNIFEAEEGP